MLVRTGAITNEVLEPTIIPHCIFKRKNFTAYINIFNYEFFRKYSATKS